MKKGIYYSIDALLAGVLITGALALIIINPFYDSSYISHNYLSEDLLNALSALKISDLEHYEFVEREIFSDSIHNPEISVLEQIGQYWALEYDHKAEELASIVLSYLNLSRKEVTLKIGDEEISSFGDGRLGDVSVSKRMIAGVERGRPLGGSSAAAYLRRIRDKQYSQYHFFGGFIGQGNISFFISDIPKDINVSGISRVDNLYLEGDFQSNFLFYINNALCSMSPGNNTFLVESSLLEVDSWDLPHCSNLIVPGRNDFEIIFLDDIRHASVSGGLLRIDYRTDELQREVQLGEDTYYFHGVEGIANIYDSFYVPGHLKEMSVFLNFTTNQSAYITIGERILSMNTGDESDILNDVVNEVDGNHFRVWIDNDFLLNEANFDYEQLGVNTVPLRFAAYEAVSEELEGGNADVVVITDFSGSMKKELDSWRQGNAVPIRYRSWQDDCVSAFDPRARRTSLALCLNLELVDVLMNYTGNRLWPVFYGGIGRGGRNDVQFYDPTPPHSKSDIMSYITSEFGNKQGDGETCIACAINQAYDILKEYGSDDRPKFVVLMSDGAPTHCARGSCNSTSTIYGFKDCIGFCDTSGASGCDDDEMTGCQINDSSCLLAEENTISSTRRLVNELNVTVFTIGFGLIDECHRAHNLLGNLSVIGNGTYQHSSDVEELRLIYENISYEILSRIDQTNQTVIVQGEMVYSSLFGDSRIDFVYDPIIPEPNPGKISLVFEQELSSSTCTNIVNVYPGLDIIEAEVTSYSGPHWTSEVIVNDVTVFNLSDYFVPYFRLGDPFSVMVPVYSLQEGSNIITVQRGDSPDNITGCSAHNKFVYTALLPAVTDRTDALESAEGCTWFVETIYDSVLEMNIPDTYSGNKTCFYNSSFVLGDFDEGDAYDSAMFSLMSQLDPLGEGRIIVDLDAEDLEIRLTIIGSIPYMWGPSIAEVEVVS